MKGSRLDMTIWLWVWGMPIPTGLSKWIVKILKKDPFIKCE